MTPSAIGTLPNAHDKLDLHTTYYSQRSQTPGTLLITEGTPVAPIAAGFPNTPGIWTNRHIDGWKTVVEEVHRNKSFVFMQLFGGGRAVSQEVLSLEGPYQVHSASAIPLKGGAPTRALTREELKGYVELFVTAAKNFVERSGGDGIEVHLANGYLLNGFINPSSNTRTDEYGGSIANRARFPLEVVDAVVAAIGSKRTAVRLSPYSAFQEMKLSSQEETVETYSYIVTTLAERHPDLAFLHVVESRTAGSENAEASESETLDFIRDIWSPRPIVLAGGHTRQIAFEETEKHPNTLTAWGRYFISNPDLVERLRHDLPLTKYNRETFYTLGPEATHGYTDYERAVVQEELTAVEGKQ